MTVPRALMCLSQFLKVRPRRDYIGRGIGAEGTHWVVGIFEWDM